MYAEERRLVFIETSAKTATNVSKLFYEIGKPLFFYGSINCVLVFLPHPSHDIRRLFY